VRVKVTERGGEKVPELEGADMAVAALVHACHEKPVDEALRRLALPGLDRGTLEPILTYCAEMRCEADGATCPGCRRRTEARGITSFDAFVRRHRQIVVGEGNVRLAGPGEGVLTTASLEDLSRNWSGEAYWYWARRVLRKLRHGIRRADRQGAAAAGEGETPAVILMEPQLAENIGMVARACANFGLDDLRLVAPRDGWPNEKARIAASGANYVVDQAAAVATLADATADLHWVAATTARQRDLRKPVLTPEQAIAEISERIASGQRCGLLFGRERNGLSTREIADAHAIVMIPVNSRFASLNLAQAVLLLGYEWLRNSSRATLGRVTTFERPLSAGFNMGDGRLATGEELQGFFQHLEAELDRLGFFNPPDKRRALVQNLRSMFLRMEATEQEVRTLRGIVAALARGKGRGRKVP
jgi:tRNA/rRNA methyltransferase